MCDRGRNPSNHINIAIDICNEEGVLLEFLIRRPGFRLFDETPGDPTTSHIRELLWEFGRIAIDDGSELSKHVAVHLRWVGIFSDSDFYHRETQRPDIR